MGGRHAPANWCGQMRGSTAGAANSWQVCSSTSVLQQQLAGKSCASCLPAWLVGDRQAPAGAVSCWPAMPGHAPS